MKAQGYVSVCARACMLGNGKDRMNEFILSIGQKIQFEIQREKRFYQYETTSVTKLINLL